MDICPYLCFQLELISYNLLLVVFTELAYIRSGATHFFPHRLALELSLPKGLISQLYTTSNLFKNKASPRTGFLVKRCLLRLTEKRRGDVRFFPFHILTNDYN